jgi:hypothetical protein
LSPFLSDRAARALPPLHDDRRAGVAYGLNEKIVGGRAGNENGQPLPRKQRRYIWTFEPNIKGSNGCRRDDIVMLLDMASLFGRQIVAGGHRLTRFRVSRDICRGKGEDPCRIRSKI